MSEALGVAAGLGLQAVERLVKLGLLATHPGESQKLAAAYTVEDLGVGAAALWYGLTAEKDPFKKWLAATYGALDLLSVPLEALLAWILWMLGVDP